MSSVLDKPDKKGEKKAQRQLKKDLQKLEEQQLKLRRAAAKAAKLEEKQQKELQKQQQKEKQQREKFLKKNVAKKTITNVEVGGEGGVRGMPETGTTNINKTPAVTPGPGTPRVGSPRRGNNVGLGGYNGGGYNGGGNVNQNVVNAGGGNPNQMSNQNQMRPQGNIHADPQDEVFSNQNFDQEMNLEQILNMSMLTVHGDVFAQKLQPQEKEFLRQQMAVMKAAQENLAKQKNLTNGQKNGQNNRDNFENLKESELYALGQGLAEMDIGAEVADEKPDQMNQSQIHRSQMNQAMYQSRMNQSQNKSSRQLVRFADETKEEQKQRSPIQSDSLNDDQSSLLVETKGTHRGMSNGMMGSSGKKQNSILKQHNRYDNGPHNQHALNTTPQQSESGSESLNFNANFNDKFSMPKTVSSHEISNMSNNMDNIIWNKDLNDPSLQQQQQQHLFMAKQMEGIARRGDQSYLQNRQNSAFNSNWLDSGTVQESVYLGSPGMNQGMNGINMNMNSMNLNPMNPNPGSLDSPRISSENQFSESEKSELSQFAEVAQQKDFDPSEFQSWVKAQKESKEPMTANGIKMMQMMERVLQRTQAQNQMAMQNPMQKNQMQGQVQAQLHQKQKRKVEKQIGNEGQQIGNQIAPKGRQSKNQGPPQNQTQNPGLSNSMQQKLQTAKNLVSVAQAENLLKGVNPEKFPAHLFGNEIPTALQALPEVSEQIQSNNDIDRKDTKKKKKTIGIAGQKPKGPKQHNIQQSMQLQVNTKDALISDWTSPSKDTINGGVNLDENPPWTPVEPCSSQSFEIEDKSADKRNDKRSGVKDGNAGGNVIGSKIQNQNFNQNQMFIGGNPNLSQNLNNPHTQKGVAPTGNQIPNIKGNAKRSFNQGPQHNLQHQRPFYKPKGNHHGGGLVSKSDKGDYSDSEQSGFGFPSEGDDLQMKIQKQIQKQLQVTPQKRSNTIDKLSSMSDEMDFVVEGSAGMYYVQGDISAGAYYGQGEKNANIGNLMKKAANNKHSDLKKASGIMNTNAGTMNNPFNGNTNGINNTNGISTTQLGNPNQIKIEESWINRNVKGKDN